MPLKNNHPGTFGIIRRSAIDHRLSAMDSRVWAALINLTIQARMPSAFRFQPWASPQLPNNVRVRGKLATNASTSPAKTQAVAPAKAPLVRM